MQVSLSYVHPNAQGPSHTCDTGLQTIRLLKTKTSTLIQVNIVDFTFLNECSRRLFMAKKLIKSSSLALSTALVTSLAAGQLSASEATNPFTLTELSGGYMQLADASSADKTVQEGKSGNKKPEQEGKCGEGKCGNKNEMKKNMEGKCGGKKAEQEGKCGEGKCGSTKK